MPFAVAAVTAVTAVASVALAGASVATTTATLASAASPLVTPIASAPRCRGPASDRLLRSALPSIGIASAAIAVIASVTTALAAACVVTHASTAAIAAIASALRFSQAGHPVQRPLSTGHLRRS